MQCKHFKTRTKKGNKYFYCILKKETITYDDCRYCSDKEYKDYKPIKKRTYKQSKKEKERFSIIYHDLSKCCVCSSKIGIEKNEIFEGAYRQTSIKYGMVAPMCRDHHKKFHEDTRFNLYFKDMFQKEFLKTHTLDEFISLFKQDYCYKFGKNKRNNLY